MSKREQGFEYTGMDNLEVMLEAQNYNRFLTDQVIANRVAGGAILDFGAGIGTFAEMVQSRGIEVHCLEPDERQAALLHAKGFETFSSADDIAAASYDYIYSLNVFEHIEDDGTAVNQAYRILKPGGALYIYPACATSSVPRASYRANAPMSTASVFLPRWPTTSNPATTEHSTLQQYVFTTVFCSRLAA